MGGSDGAARSYRVAWATGRFAGLVAVLLLVAYHPAAAVAESTPHVATPSARATSTDGPVSFRHDVMPLLSKAGCNMGICHGNAQGKGGFKLSLRGEDPDFDYRALTRERFARRIDPAVPEQSLLLRKPTLGLAHEGGRRFAVGDREYRILRQWIAAGAPDDRDTVPRLLRLEVRPQHVVLVEPDNEVQLQATAHFADGTSRDVTSLASYETSDPRLHISPQGRMQRSTSGEFTVLVRYLDAQVPVRVAFVPLREGFTGRMPAPRNYIDEHIFAKLSVLRINPAPACDDTVFLRRAYLDLLGRLPTADEARTFVADSQPDKRAALVDALLRRDEFADYWALQWCDLLRVEEKQLDRKGVQNFHHWIRRSFADGKPLDRMARELIAARGSTYSQPAANWYRANREVLERAENTARVFLGTRLQCARCHNHPFDRWTQDDYYDWAAWFAGVQYKILENNRRDRNDHHEFDGEQVVWIARDARVTNARTGQPAVPRFLGDSAGGHGPDEDPLEVLADWVTRRDNRRFVATQVNRIWAQLLGRGLVHEVDDFRETNPASHPELLEALCRDFVEHDCDVRHLIRQIMQSHAYQASSEPDETNRDDEANFARAPVRRLRAEVLLDAVCQALDAPVRFNGYPLGTRAVQIPGVQAVRPRDQSPAPGDQFLLQFGKPPRLLACECERRDDATLKQAFSLVSGPVVHALLTRADNRLGRLLAADLSPEGMIEELYWWSLSRPPTAAEHAALGDYVRRAADRRAALEDVAWGILSSAEFLFRR
jgi:hypothetical protein